MLATQNVRPLVDSPFAVRMTCQVFEVSQVLSAPFFPESSDVAAGWLQNDEIVVPSRVAGGVVEQRQRTGLRQKYEQRNLRQQYAADDTTVPETALRRVDEYVFSPDDLIQYTSHCI